MYKKLFGAFLMGACLLASSALAALPKEGVYEKHSKDGTLEARMYVMGEHGATKYTFGYGNENAQIIWIEGYMANGEKHGEFATKYIWKTDNAGGAESALILDREGVNLLGAGKLATPIYAQDMAVFSFDDNGRAKVGVGKGFTGEPQSWKNGRVADSFSGTYSYINDDLTFTPLSMAYVMEATGNPKRLMQAEATNQEWNQAKVRFVQTEKGYDFVENMMEQGLLVKMTADLGKKVTMNAHYGRGVLLGSEVRLRANTTTDARIKGMLALNEEVEVLGYEKGLDGRGWYYVVKADGLEGFAAAQFIELR